MASTSTVGTLPTVSKPPKYCRQRDKNRVDRAYVRINGKTIWLGEYGSSDSRQRYAELIDNPQPQPKPAEVVTMAIVMAAYLEHAKAYYRRPDGKPGREYEVIREVLSYVRKNCSGRPAKDFGPKRLKEIRQAMIEADHSRRSIRTLVAFEGWSVGPSRKSWYRQQCIRHWKPSVG